MQTWLLTARAMEDLPDDIRDHIKKCDSCRRQLQLLKQVDATVATLAFPPGRAGAIARLEERLDGVRRDGPTITSDCFARRLHATRRILLPVSAAALLIGLGWILGYFTPSLPKNIPALGSQIAFPGNKRTPTVSEKTLLIRLVEHDVRLSETDEPADQVETLVRMADDISGEALRCVQRGSFDEVSLLANLYELVVRQGVLPKWASLPDDRKAAMLPGVVQQFRTTEADAKVLERDALPIVGDRFRSIGATAREAQDILQTGRQLDPKALLPLPVNEASLLAVLVHQGLRLIATDDPLQRAELCADLSQPLAEKLILLSAAGDDQLTTEIGLRLDELMGRGVADNLERVASAADAEKRRDGVNQVRQRAAQVTSALESNLSRAPLTAKPGLERALEASQNGRLRAVQAGKGKDKSGKSGPPWLRKDENNPDRTPAKGNGPPGKAKGATPPGLQKKSSHDSESKR